MVFFFLHHGSLDLKRFLLNFMETSSHFSELLPKKPLKGGQEIPKNNLWRSANIKKGLLFKIFDETQLHAAFVQGLFYLGGENI